MNDILEKIGIVLDATVVGVGKKNKEVYEKYGVMSVFQSREKNEIADVFFHSYAIFKKGVDRDIWNSLPVTLPV